MRGKVHLYVRSAASRRAYEFRVPHELEVGQVADLMARLLGAREEVRVGSPSEVRLMLVDAPAPGALLLQRVTIADYMRSEVLVDGSHLVLL